MTDWHLLADEQAFRAVVLDDDRPVVVAFEPDPCRACRDQRTLLSLLWRQLGWSVGAGRVLIDRTPQLGQRYDIAFYPTLVVFWRGEPVDRLPGPRHPDAVNRRLAALLHPPEGPAAPSRSTGPPPPLSAYQQDDPHLARYADDGASRAAPPARSVVAVGLTDREPATARERALHTPDSGLRCCAAASRR